MIVVRKATPLDRDCVNHILKTMDMVGFIDEENDVMVIEKEGFILGTGGVKIEGDRGEIRFIAVLHEYWNQGLEDCLVRALINFSDRRGVKDLYVVVKSNRALFEKIGFQPCIQRGISSLTLNIDEFFNNPHCQH